MSNDDDIDIIAEMVRLEKRQFRITVAGVLIIISVWGVLVGGAAIHLSHLRSEIASAETQKARLLVAVAQLRTVAENQKTTLSTMTDLAATQSRVPANLVQQAKETITASEKVDKQVDAVVPIVGVLAANTSQMPQARQFADMLRAKGFLIQNVRPIHAGGIPPDDTEVRYFRASGDPGDATQIADILRTHFGVANAIVTRDIANDTPPNKYEVWFDKAAFVAPSKR